MRSVSVTLQLVHCLQLVAHFSKHRQRWKWWVYPIEAISFLDCTFKWMMHLEDQQFA
jgi:hypothetical protein